MMDAVEFLDKVDRLSKRGSTEEKMRYTDYRAAGDNVGAVKFVERWAVAHPVKTRQSAFMEQWPNARISNVDGFPVINPCGLDSTVVNECDVASCSKCRSKFWLAEVEDA